MSKHSNNIVLGVDVGGSHVAAALVDMENREMIPGSFHRRAIDSTHSNAEEILNEWTITAEEALKSMNGSSLRGIGVAMPGPFDYDNGISLITGVNKYEALYGLNIKEELRQRLPSQQDVLIRFENDAACFGLGESINGIASGYQKILIITLGTGLAPPSSAISRFLKQAKAYHPMVICIINPSWMALPKTISLPAG